MQTIQIIGPFITNFSYAKVNRGLARAIHENFPDYKVNLYQAKDKIDRWPDESDLARHSFVKEIWTKEPVSSDITFYLDFPKGGIVPMGLENLPGKNKIIYVVWEETVYPKIWVDEINKNMHGVMAATEFVKEILIQNGVKIPIQVVHMALGQGQFLNPTENYGLRTNKQFKFLHISSGRARKGVDVLLKAYLEEFNSEDDVCLVVKTFPNPDNIFSEEIPKITDPNAPEIEVINNLELTEQQIVNLINTCNASIYPSRAEGFGLPHAESMLHAKPVIATNYSSYLDFLNTDSGFMIDYKLVNATDSEMANVGSKWAEPSLEDLKKQMRYLYEHRDKFDEEPIKSKLEKAKASALKLNYKNTAKNAIGFAKRINEIKNLKSKRLGVVGRINSEDGIAEYTRHLYQNIIHSFEKLFFIANEDITDRVRKDEENVVRLWSQGEVNFEKVLEFVKGENLDFINIQYHSGFHFPSEGLSNLILKLKELGVKVIVTLHAVRSESFDHIKNIKNLKLADKVIIHNKTDFDYAAKYLKNVDLFTLPVLQYKKRDKSILKSRLGFSPGDFIITTHGLLNFNKNVPMVAEAFAEIKSENPQKYSRLKLLCLNAVSSNNTASTTELKKLEKIISDNKLGNDVTLVTDFLSAKQIEILMQSSDLCILPYKEVGETSSDAVRKCLSANVTTVVSDIKQFSEFKSEVFKLKQTSVEEIKKAVKLFYSEKDPLAKSAESQDSSSINTLQKKKDQIKKSMREFVEKNSFSTKSVDFLHVIQN